MEGLLERRSYLCRLTPDRALDSPEEMLEFLRDRGLITRTADSALPSFFGACHEEPYAAGSRGFGSWPATKYPWYFELARRTDVHELRIHNGKSVLLSDATLVLVDPICRAELARLEQEDEPARLLSHLAEVGPSTVADLRTELEVSSNQLKRLRGPLERCGAVVSRGVRMEVPDAGHVHTSVLFRYDQAYPDPPRAPGGIDDLIVAAAQAAVVAPEREIARGWFSWRALTPPALVDRLVDDGRLRRVGPGWVVAPASE